jgi:hypothetical protein
MPAKGFSGQPHKRKNLDGTMPVEAFIKKKVVRNCLHRGQARRGASGFLQHFIAKNQKHEQ